MYVPWDRSSRAKDGSTSDVHLVSRFALSLGTGLPQLEHWIISLRPLPPLLRPRDFRFLVNYFHYRDCYSFVGRTRFKRCELEVEFSMISRNMPFLYQVCRTERIVLMLVR